MWFPQLTFLRHFSVALVCPVSLRSMVRPISFGSPTTDTVQYPESPAIVWAASVSRGHACSHRISRKFRRIYCELNNRGYGRMELNGFCVQFHSLGMSNFNFHFLFWRSVAMPYDGHHTTQFHHFTECGGHNWRIV